MKRFKKRPSPAMIVAVTALFISLVGTAFADPIAEISGLNKKDKRTVRKISRNISGKVSNRRITKRAPGLNVASAGFANVSNVANAANSAINATNAKNAEDAENAANAENAENSDKVDGHDALCPEDTTLIRGICFDSVSNPAVSTVFVASDNCRGKGGYLPTGMALRSTRNQLNLGGGVGTDRQYTDMFYVNGGASTTIFIQDDGGFSTDSATADAEYICAYPLVR